MIKNLLLSCCLILGSCITGSTAPQDPRQPVIEFARALGSAIIQVHGTEFIKEKAPQLLPLIDKDGNGVVTLAEIEAISFNDPDQLALLLVALEDVYKQYAKKK